MVSEGHSRLLRWAVWAKGFINPSRYTSPLGKLYRSPQHWHAQTPRPERATDIEGKKTDEIVSKMPDKQRQCVIAKYLYKAKPDPKVLRAIGLSRRSWFYSLSAARNRLDEPLG